MIHLAWAATPRWRADGIRLAHGCGPHQPALRQGDRLHPHRVDGARGADSQPQSCPPRRSRGADARRQDDRVDLREDLDPDPMCLRGGGLPPGCPAHLPRPARQPDRAQGVVRRHRSGARPALRRHRVPRVTARGLRDPGEVCRCARLQRANRHVAPDSGAVRHRHHGRALAQAGRRDLLRLRRGCPLQHGELVARRRRHVGDGRADRRPPAVVAQRRDRRARSATRRDHGCPDRVDGGPRRRRCRSRLRAHRRVGVDGRGRRGVGRADRTPHALPSDLDRDGVHRKPGHEVHALPALVPQPRDGGGGEDLRRVRS